MRLDTLASGCAILAVALLANPLSSPARAADGALDPAFSANGLTTVDFALGTNKNDYAQVAVVQSDGKLLVAGTSEYTSIDSDFTVARLLMNGSLDTTFSGDGLASVAFDLSSPNHMRDSLRSIALDRDGKILLCGVARDAASHSRVAVARLLPNGSLDASFSGDGKLDLDAAPGNPNDDWCHVIPVRSGGYLVTTTWALVRLTSSGALLTSFSGDGYSDALPECSITYEDCGFRQSAELRDGSFLTAGYGTHSAPPGDIPLVLHHFANGSIDASWGASGILELAPPTLSFHHAFGIALARDGKPVVFLHNRVQGGHDSYVTRLSGELIDPTFSAAGWQHLATLAGGDWDWTDFALGPDDKILLTGSEYLGLQQSVARLLANGSALDNSFDSDGRMTFEFIPGIQAGYAAGMAIGGGRPHAVGTVLNQTDDDFGIARLTTSAVFTDGFEYGPFWFWSGTSTP